MSGGYPQDIKSLMAGETLSFDCVFQGGIRMLESAPVTADTLIYTGPCMYYGYMIGAQTASNVITVEDGLTAGTGTVKETIPSGTAIGRYPLPQGMAIYCPTGLFLNFTGTGTVAVLYWPAT